MSYYAATAQSPPASSKACITNGSGNSMSHTLDPLSLRFVIWAQSAGAPSLDAGCGDGSESVPRMDMREAKTFPSFPKPPAPSIVVIV